LAISYTVFMHVKIITLLVRCADTSESRSSAYNTDNYVKFIKSAYYVWHRKSIVLSYNIIIYIGLYANKKFNVIHKKMLSINTLFCKVDR